MEQQYAFNVYFKALYAGFNQCKSILFIKLNGCKVKQILGHKLTPNFIGNVRVVMHEQAPPPTNSWGLLG